MGTDDLFFHKLVAPLANEMGDAYPDLVKAQAHVEKVLKKEEQRFAEQLVSKIKQNSFWIDGSDAESESNWKFSDGRVIKYANWAKGRPQNEPKLGLVTEFYVHFPGSTPSQWSPGWYDVPGHMRFFFICEWDQ